MPQVSKSTSRPDFDAIAVSVASPDDVLSWSYGEVQKPETINYRTQKPERGGLFCEKIFGPTKNWQCYCGKYKGIRYKGVVCEKCGVEITRSVVRRERMGHIKLAVPVTHIWFLRSTPSSIGLLLDLPIKQIEQVVYFAAYIVTEVNNEALDEALKELESEHKKQLHAIKTEHEKKVREAVDDKKLIATLEAESAESIQELQESYEKAKSELKNLAVGKVISEIEYRDLSMRFGHVFKAGIGAEAIRDIITNIDLDTFIEERRSELANTAGQKQKKLIKRMKLAAGMRKARIRPEWMILTVLPVIPPDLRPMVQLDGGRFAASDLNDLYRRVINRNNRLKKLLEIGAPEVICRNEKRMLQEAVDALLNSDARQGKTTFNVNERRKLRSLSDMLKGKQGRFRQNLLGKRVDYSGRSVIVVGPDLELHQCGLPKEMALKLFKPFIVGELIKQGLAYNLKNAERVIQSNKKEVWDILERITAERYVLLNRAPTLHRLGIQAFQPKLIDGKAIQLHPLVCAAFNADFDGDQMAVHVPLSDRAQQEARERMSSVQNLLKPSHGEPIATASQDMVLGCYYLTSIDESLPMSDSVFADGNEALRAMEAGVIKLRQQCRIRINGEIHEMTVGRFIFNEVVPECIGFVNTTMDNKALKKIVNEAFVKMSIKETAVFVDKIKKIGFEYATKSAITMAGSDILTPTNKPEVLEEANQKIAQIGNLFWKGWITEKERYTHTIGIWNEAKQRLAKAILAEYPADNHISMMVRSGARGSWEQVTQLCGMKGLVANPSGKTIELPIKSSLKEGMSILEYFIATHGGRKGKSDTALKTANAGYLTRRLVDSVQDILIKEEDCGTDEYRTINPLDDKGELNDRFQKQVFGRMLADDVVDAETGEVLLEKGTLLTHEHLNNLANHSFNEVKIRSVMTCQTENGVCQNCYGLDLGNYRLAEQGTAVGVIAAQSIGEPGTQLTMRTFHQGGVAGGADITQGLERVEELFEARTPKTPAIIAEIDGVVTVDNDKERNIVEIEAEGLGEDVYTLPYFFAPAVKVNENVKENQIIARSTQDKNVLKSTFSGKVIATSDREIIIAHTSPQKRSYNIHGQASLRVRSGDRIQAGTALTYGHLDLKKLQEIMGVEKTQEYILDDIQHIYASQGQSINDKHLEIIVKQMFSKIRILDAGDTKFLPGEIVNVMVYKNRNKKALAEELRPATGERLLLGLTKIASYTPSWLSAASFQETIRTLVRSSVSRVKDNLEGLKENVIIGKLIPTQPFHYNEDMAPASEESRSPYDEGEALLYTDDGEEEGEEVDSTQETLKASE